MRTFRHSSGLVPKLAGWLLWPLILLALLSVPPTARAACIADANPEIRQLQSLVGENATQALKRVQSRLKAALEAPAASQDAAELAALYDVEAEAYGILELAPEARAAALKGLGLVTDLHSPLRVQLLADYADGVYDGAGITTAIKDIEAERLAQAPHSAADTCLLITRGLLEHRQGRADLAIVTLTQAYADSTAPTVTERHILAATVLSVVMRSMGDYAQALALNQEAIDWDSAHGASLSLSVSRFMRGQVLRLMGSYDAAIVEFSQARKLSVTLDDDQGVAFADLRICEAHIELAQLATARHECANAESIFSAAHAADSVKEAEALSARIELGEGHPERALAILNGVLDHDGADLAPRGVARLYESRARANAALQNYRDAYRDLQEYLGRYVAANDAERREQAGALRARFETDREIERNASLKHELIVSREQSSRQARQLRWNAVVVVAGVCVITLLIYFLLANFKYRQRLIKLASVDGLTGLANRRRIAQVAAAALESAKSTGRPLCIAIIDMDHFKVINDRCGHATGDYVLKEFARVGAEAVREPDTLGRWGGEEFLLVMPETTLDAAAANLERVRTLVYGIRLPASGAGLQVSLSAGLAAFDPSVKSLDELIARADGALYSAKNAGRDLVRIADAGQLTGPNAVRRAARN